MIRDLMRELTCRRRITGAERTVSCAASEQGSGSGRLDYETKNAQPSQRFSTAVPRMCLHVNVGSSYLVHVDSISTSVIGPAH
eukprot:COSAG06_NODE_2277_length_7190_cov_3.824848_2_plen_83_part_00